MNTISDVEEVLNKARQYICQGMVDFIKGKEEKEALNFLGISIDDAFAMVEELTFRNYYRGPSRDHKFPEQLVWEFGVEDVFIEEELPKRTLYIKITFRLRNGKDDLLMMSFHPADKLITFPYKEA